MTGENIYEADISEKVLLQFLQESGMINMDDVRDEMNKRRKKEILKNHPYKIWQDKHGRWWTQLPDTSKKEGRHKVVKSKLEDLHEVLYSYYGEGIVTEKKKPVTLETLYPEWLDYKRLHTEASTYITRLDSDWKSYYIGTDIIKIPIKDLDKITLDKWAHSLVKEHTMTKTCYYNVTTILRQALDYAKEQGMISFNPMREVKISSKLFRKVKKKSNETQVFTTEERKLITQYAWDDFHNEVKDYVLSPLAMLFQFETGIRIGELCAVRYEDLEGDHMLHIQRMYRRDSREVVDHAKTDAGDRIIILTPTAKHLIETARDYQKEHLACTDKYIFTMDGKPMKPHCINELYKKYSKYLGGPHRSSHKSRKTWISSLIDCPEMNINTIREMAGHEDERTTFKNYCFDRSTEHEKVENMVRALSLT